jgi:mutator protein MutT
MTKPTYKVALALVRRGAEWLVARRLRAAHLGGLWEFPGGKCHLHETPTQAALRELLEECAVHAEPQRVLDAVICEYDDRIVHLTPVLCRWLAGQPQALASETCRWVSEAELAELEMPAVNAGIIRAAHAADAND